MKKAFQFLRDTVSEFLAEDPFTHAAALSYYSLLSLAPLLLVVVAVAGIVFGEEAARGEVMARLGSMMGPEAAAFVAGVLAQAHQSGGGWLSAVIGLGGVLVGATTAFSHLQAALNKIWGVEAPRQPLIALLRTRGLAFLFVILLGAAVVALLVASSVISHLRARTGLGALGVVWRLADVIGPLALMTALFAALFRWLPDARVRWRDVWVGAAITSLLFVVGRLVIGLYLGRAGVGSAYGAAGSAIVVMVWIYYSAVIVLFGAEITQIYASKVGGGLRSRTSNSSKGHVLKDISQVATSPRSDLA